VLWIQTGTDTAFPDLDQIPFSTLSTVYLLCKNFTFCDSKDWTGSETGSAVVWLPRCAMILIELKIWIQIRTETNANQQNWKILKILTPLYLYLFKKIIISKNVVKFMTTK
jgi:hypothetical protein